MALGSSGRRIVVEFIGDASALKSGVNDGEKALQGFSGKAQAAGRIAGKALAGGLLLAGAAAVSATKAAAEDEAAQSQLAQQLKQAANASDTQIASLENWISAQGIATGITDDELRPALAKLATATGDVGEAQKLAALAMDVSAGTGKDLNQVTEALVRAQNGSIGGLSRLGVATKDASGKTLDLASVTQLMADKYTGAAAKAADTSAGKTKIMTTQFGELQEQIGAKLLPVMVKLADIGLKVVNWVSNNTTTVGVLIGVLGTLLAVTWAVGVATKLQATWTALSTAATKAAAAGQWLLNAAMSANPIGLVVIAIAALVAGLIIAYKKSETFRNIVNGAFSAVAHAAEAAVNFIKDHWKPILAILTGPIGAAVILIMSHWDKIKASAAAVIGWVQDRWPPLKAMITGPFDSAKGVISTILEGVRVIFANTKEKISNIASDMRSTLTAAFDAIKAPIQSVIDKVQWLIDKIQSLIDKVKNIPSIDIPGFKIGGGGGGSAAPSSRPFSHTPQDVLGGAVAGAAARGSSGQAAPLQPMEVHVHFGLVGDPVAAAREFVGALRKLERTTGRKLLVSPG